MAGKLDTADLPGGLSGQAFIGYLPLVGNRTTPSGAKSSSLSILLLHMLEFFKLSQTFLSLFTGRITTELPTSFFRIDTPWSSRWSILSYNGCCYFKSPSNFFIPISHSFTFPTIEDFLQVQVILVRSVPLFMTTRTPSKPPREPCVILGPHGPQHDTKRQQRPRNKLFDPFRGFRGNGHN